MPGDTDVTVDLVAGGTSTVKVSGAESIDDTLVAAALEEAADWLVKVNLPGHEVAGEAKPDACQGRRRRDRHRTGQLDRSRMKVR